MRAELVPQQLRVLARFARRTLLGDLTREQRRAREQRRHAPAELRAAYPVKSTNEVQPEVTAEEPSTSRLERLFERLRSFV